MKTAIVTGGGSGIGLAIATKFVHAGIKTIIIGRNIEKLNKAKALLGNKCIAVVADLTDLKAIPALVKAIISDHGAIHVLVNNAGINMKKEFVEVSDEDFIGVIQTNLISVFVLSREVVGHMLKNNTKGSIVNISSMASQYGIPKVIAYTAAKSAVEGMTRAMSTELAPKGIRTNCIAPGFIGTDMSTKALDSDPERKAKALGRTSMGYLGNPADIGDAALFLASDCSGYITGAIIPVDGGNSTGF
jgi:NAD(P)-dependent dehydrogenase (short-subunit alcohol dehydrogenase family)